MFAVPMSLNSGLVKEFELGVAERARKTATLRRSFFSKA
jgi:hypothetical protein